MQQVVLEMDIFDEVKLQLAYAKAVLFTIASMIASSQCLRPNDDILSDALFAVNRMLEEINDKL